MKKLSVILFLFITVTAVAQNRAFKVRGDKAFLVKDYVTAAYYYSKALQNVAATTQGTVPYFSTRQNKHPHQAVVGNITYQLAESYRLYQDYILAEDNYRQVVDKYESSYPLSRLWYAVCLRANNHFDEAVKQLQLFSKTYKGNDVYAAAAKKELANSLFAKEQIQMQTPVKAVKMGNTLNSDGSDYDLSINGGQYWFTSSRSVKDDNKRLSHIFYRNKDAEGTITRLNFAIKSKFDLHFGTPSLDVTGKRMYLTVWYKEGNKTISNIYLSKNNNGQWSAPQKLNNMVNVSGFNAMQPFVTDDGKHLYFVSDKPGGIGGTDIWVSDLNNEGIPVNAVNPGAAVNSTDDEQAPFFSEKDQKLVYSSKGFTGMGDFDLFESVNTGPKWTVPQNMGYPFNSAKADLYYRPDDKDKNTCYVSSDRESECCLNVFKLSSSTFIMAGLIIDCATNKPLPGVAINLVDSASKQVINYLNTSMDGKYIFTLAVKHAYLLRLEKPGYFTKVIPVPKVSTTQTDTLFNPLVCQQAYEVNKPIVIPNILYDFNKADLKPESKIILDGLVDILTDNPKIVVELSAHTDSFGPDWFNNRLSQSRAQSCVDYLILRGIEPSRLSARGYGETRPLVPNSFPDGKDNPAGRRLNRRTEFKVIKAE